MVFTSFRKSAIVCVAAQHHLLTIKGKNMGVRKRRQEDRAQKGGEKEEKAREEEEKKKNGSRRKRKGREGKLNLRKGLWIFTHANLHAIHTETDFRRFRFYSSRMQKNFRLSIYKKNHFNIFKFFKIVILVWHCQMDTYISQRNRRKNPEVNSYIESYFSTKVQRQFNGEMIDCSTNCAEMIIQNMCNLNPYLT